MQIFVTTHFYFSLNYCCSLFQFQYKYQLITEVFKFIISFITTKMSEVDKKRNRDESGDDVTEKKKNKKNKDKKKSKDVEAEETVEPVLEQETDASEKKKSKKKKDKKEKSEITEIDTESNSDIAGANMYKEHPTTKAMTATEADEFRNELGIQLFPTEEGETYKPMTSFDCLNPSLQGLCPYVQQYVREKNFTKPSPIQVLTASQTIEYHLTI